jgi:hypothetical protein
LNRVDKSYSAEGVIVSGKAINEMVKRIASSPREVGMLGGLPPYADETKMYTVRNGKRVEL